MKQNLEYNIYRLAIFFALMTLATVFFGCFTTGCHTPVQRTAFNTIYSVETGASTALDGYYALVIKGVVPTNDVPNIASLYDKLQADCTIAAAAAQNGVSSTATPELIAQAFSFTSTIATLTKK